MNKFPSNQEMQPTTAEQIAAAIASTKKTTPTHCCHPRQRVDDIADQINQRLGIDKPSIISAILDANSRLDELRLAAQLADSEELENTNLISVNFAQLIAEQLQQDSLQAA